MFFHYVKLIPLQTKRKKNVKLKQFWFSTAAQESNLKLLLVWFLIKNLNFLHILPKFTFLFKPFSIHSLNYATIFSAHSLITISNICITFVMKSLSFTKGIANIYCISNPLTKCRYLEHVCSSIYLQTYTVLISISPEHGCIKWEYLPDLTFTV